MSIRDKRKFNIVSWYRRFFLNERTAIAAAVLAMAVMPFILYFGIRSNAIGLAGIYDLFIRFLLVATLLHAIRTHNLLLMQATTVGLLFCMLCAQSQYALGELANVDSDTYITMGLQGFVFLAVERMILFVQSLVCFDHFMIHAARRRGTTRLYINRAAILFLLALLVVQLIIAPSLSFDQAYVMHVWTLHLDELIVFILLMCSELVLLLDSQELMGA